MWSHLSTIITIVSFVLTAAGMLVGVTWKMSGVVSELKDAIAKARDEVEARQDGIVQQFGETCAALRQKINDVELYSANTYMRRESFYQVKGEMSMEIKDFRTELKERLDRLENKIDTKT